MDLSSIIREAIALAQRGDKVQARRLIGELLQNDPNNADAWVVMAQIVDSQEEAVACMRKVLDLRPDDEHAQNYLDYIQRQNTSGKRQISPLLIAGGAAIVLLLATILLLSGLLTPRQAGSAATPTNLISCRELIDQALTVSNDNCEKLALGQVCYGHTTVRASLQPGATGRFKQMGDILSIGSLTRLSAAPLNLNTQEWGIGLFKVQANLPYTVPGQNITMVVAGNTSLENTSGTMQVFNFTSGIGGITCESVPLNGLVVRMPNGAGIRFMVNGSDVALSGDAYMQAQSDGAMQVSLFDGGGWISSQGVSKYFRAGETASVPLSGTTSSGPPTVGTGSAGDLCALFGTCSSTNPTQSSDQAVAMLQAAVTQGAGAIPTGAAGASAATSTPAPIDPNLPTNTSVPVDSHVPTNTPVPVAPGMPTNTSVPLPTNTPAPLPTNTSAPAANTSGGQTASTAAPTPTATQPAATNTPQPAATATPRPTNTSVPPTNTPEPPTNTPQPPTDTPQPVATAAPPAASCSNITLGWGGASKKVMTITITNNNASAVAVTHTDITWPSSNGNLSKLQLGSAFWTKTAAPPSASIDAVSKSVGTGSTGLGFTFTSTAASSGYMVTLTFDIGCAAAQFSN